MATTSTAAWNPNPSDSDLTDPAAGPPPPPYKSEPSNGVVTPQHGGARANSGPTPKGAGGMTRSALFEFGLRYELDAADCSGAHTDDLQTDAARLQAHGLTDLLLVDSYSLAVRQPDGFWVVLSRSTLPAFHALVKRCRDKALAGLDARLQTAGMEDAALRKTYRLSLAATFRDGQRYIADLMAYVLTWAGDSSVGLEWVVSTDFTRGHYLPTDDKDNRSIDLTSGEWVTADVVRAQRCLAPMGGVRIRASDYQPGMDLDNPPAKYAAMCWFLREHWGWPLVTRLAAHLLGTCKDIDVIVARGPDGDGGDVGKSTLLEALKQAVGAWYDPGSRVLSEKGSRFSQATTPLTKHYLGCYDEVDKPDAIAPGLANSLTAYTLLIEEKHENPRTLQRIGQPVFIGAGYPRIDVDVQGIRSRFRWVWKRDDLQRIDGDTSVAILSGVAYLLTALVKEAVTLHTLRELDGEGKDGACQEGLDAAAEMHESLTSDAAKLVNESLEPDGKGFVTVAALKDVFTLQQVDYPGDKDIRHRVLTTFPGVQSKRKTVEGKKQTCYIGVRLTADVADAHQHGDIDTVPAGADSDAIASTDIDAIASTDIDAIAPGFKGQSND